MVGAVFAVVGRRMRPATAPTQGRPGPNKVMPRKSPPEPQAGHVALVRALREARAAHDPAGVAAAQADLANEAFVAANRTLHAWMALTATHRGLLPRALDGDKQDFWNYADVAADCYSHMVIAAHLLAPDLLAQQRAMLAQERRIAPPFQAVDLKTGALFNDGRRIFGGVEYAKDGLLSILESLGDTEWSERLTEVVGQVWKNARPVRSGKVVLDDAEKNGEMLQVLARLWHRTHEPVYLKRGRAIADAYVSDVLPRSGGFPPVRYDFARDRPLTSESKLRDHGNEVVGGLVEWTLLERAAGHPQQARYAPAVERMLDGILERGRRPDGLFLNSIDEVEKPDRVLNDNWGYVAISYQAYGESLPVGDPRRARYLEAARSSLIAASRQRGANWEWNAMDGFADSIEGALYMLAAVPEPEAGDWIDDEIGRLLAYSAPDGFVHRTYLDGNFVRTSLLYGLWKTAGVRPQPWRPGLRLGMERDGEGWRLSLRSDAAWQGVIRFDGPRHREVLHLPSNYPRLNEWPEWFAVESERSYSIEDASTKQRRTLPGRDLRAGIPVAVEAGKAMSWRIAEGGD